MTGPNGSGQGPRDDDTIAAEYVLHLLDHDERAAVRRRLAGSASLRVRVLAWMEALAQLTGELAEEAPPPELRARLSTYAAREGRRGRGFARGVAIGLALAAAAVVALAVLLPRVGLPGSGAVLVGSLAGEVEPFRYEARYDRDAARLVVARQEGEPGGADADHQLWILPAGASAPSSLGVLDDEGTIEITVDEALARSLPGALLEVSREPEGGSPEDGPTGAVLAKGLLPET